jgi:Bacterial pre-peptidase C-terminal domain
MSLIPNFPQNLLDVHHHWHDPNAHPGTPGGRVNGFGTPGGGLEFLQFHRDFVAQFHIWYDTQPFADPVAVAPWTSIPAALKNPALTGWNATLAVQEARITTNSPAFTTADELGTYIEGGIHGWIHSATAIAFNEPVVANFHSPQSTYFYQIHGLVDGWWQVWESGRPQPQVVPLTVGALPTQASIGQPGETDLYSFEVQAAGRYTLETQGQIDVVMSLYGPNNLATLIAEDDDSGPGSNARIERNLTAGTYYVRVRHYSPQDTGAYGISVQGGSVVIPTIPVNGPAIQGNIAAPNESDLYTFTADVSGLYTSETAGNTDTFLTLFGPNSQTLFIAQDDDSGPGSNARIVTTLAAGFYYVRVRHYSPTGTGPYSLLVRR